MNSDQNSQDFSPPPPEDPHSIKHRMMSFQLQSRPEVIAKMICEIRSCINHSDVNALDEQGLPFSFSSDDTKLAKFADIAAFFESESCQKAHPAFRHLAELYKTVSTASSGKLAAIHSNFWGDDTEDKEFVEHLNEVSEDDCLRIARDVIEWAANSKAIGDIPEDKHVDISFEDLANIAQERRATVRQVLEEVIEELDPDEELTEADVEYLAMATGMGEEGIKSWFSGRGSKVPNARKILKDQMVG